jgi:fatty-acyl-CoA synthase
MTRVGYSDDDAYSTSGPPFPFMEIKIVDSNRRLLPINTDGEICMRGYGVMKGYWDEPQKTAETIDQNGWLHSGDIGSMNAEGLVTFKSRAKELIIRGGVNIYPAEVEAFFRTHPDVIDVYCIGVPDERVGEEICVWVKLKPDAKLTKEQLIEFCTGKIAYFKVPKFVKFVDGFPINPNGKVQKFKIVEQMKKELNL